jgi:hypothetical protein
MPIVIRHATAAQLLERGGSFLLESEAENNLILGICGDLAANPPADDNQSWLLTIEHDQTVIGAAVMVPPRPLVITRLSSGARSSLVVFFVDSGLSILRVVGPSPDVGALAELWRQCQDVRASLEMDQRIYACEHVIPPVRPIPGNIRAADLADHELLVAWSRDFHVAVHSADAISECGKLIDRLIGRRAISIWDDNGPVSCAALSRDTARGVAINHVYTPPVQRGRGYASACVADLTTQQLGNGKRFCCLYTDLGNPTSNKIYQQIGYRPVCDSQMWRFA